METVEIGKKKKLFVPFFSSFHFLLAQYINSGVMLFPVAFPFLFFRVQKEKDSGGRAP